MVLKLENSLVVKDLKEMFRKKATETCDISAFVIRMFMRGKEMKDNHLMGEFNVGNEDMLQVFLQAKG
jgi:hypothetical protein